jgi:hypothetical protein
MSAEKTGRRERAVLWQARLACLSAFGPYIVSGMRTEQVVVFTLAIWTLATGWPHLMRGQPGLLPVMVLWLGLIAVTLIGTCWRPLEIGTYGTQPVSHGLAALLLPLALMMLAWSWSAHVPPARLALLAARIIVTGMCLNTSISVAQAATRNPQIIGILPRFWDAPGSNGSVALNAAANWRYTGIFNQPAEAGMAYALALCCLIYLAQIRGVRAGTTAAAILVLAAGGVLTGSKVFLIGAAPVTLLMTMRDHRSRARILASGACAVGALWLAAVGGAARAWAGDAEVSRLLNPSVALWSAGRYGTGATLGPVVADVLRSSPWYGFGAGGLAAAYDSLWVEVLIYAGVTGLILTALTLAVLAARCLYLRGHLDDLERRLACAALAVAVGASLGIPSLTVNRASVLLWLTLGPLLTTVARPGRPTAGGTMP